MRPFIISTDSTSDLSPAYVEAHQILVLPLYYTLGSATYGTPTSSLSPQVFYDYMRAGELPFTHATNPLEIMKTFSSYLKEGFDILHISFSSNLSSAYNNVSICAKELLSNEPDAKIIVIDSLSATTGLGLLVHRAVMAKENGASIEAIADQIREDIPHVIHEFTVDDLTYLKRSGRIAKSTALIGNKLNLKPIMHMNKEGKLSNLYQVHGRKKALKTLVKRMAEQIQDYDQTLVFVAHADCYEDAEYVAHLIKETYEVQEVIINDISPTIGAHVGPGTLSIQYMGASRETSY